MNLFHMRTWLVAKFSNDERGASMIEYALLAALIAVVVIAAVIFVGGETKSTFSKVGTELENNN